MAILPSSLSTEYTGSSRFRASTSAVLAPDT